MQNLLIEHTVAQSLVVLSLVAATGVILGGIRIFGVRLGVAGVLFAGIVLGHFQISVDHKILEFCREFGLVLFVYTIGIQVGPGFFSSLKRDGLSLNLLASFVVLSGAALTISLVYFFKIPLPAAVGLFSGATTNTPSLGAAQQALRNIPGVDPGSLELPALGYAVAYPFGILGIILTMLLVRKVFAVNLSREAEAHESSEAQKNIPLTARNIRVDNPNLNGVAITNLPNIDSGGIVISRVLHEGRVRVALGETKLYCGDILYAVGATENLDELQMIVGSRSDIDIRQVQSNIVTRRLLVTKPDAVGKTIADLKVRERYGITVTRISRSDIEFPATTDIPFHFADTLIAVGEEEDINEFAEEIGNSAKQLEHPFVVPLFIGILLGIILGSWSFFIPGIPSPVKLGMAGGPLLVAIILSRIGRIGPVIWYMPISANYMLRELGIVLFLACVGISSGGRFVEVLLNGQGLFWMFCGALITLVPIVLMAFFAKWKMKMNYLTLCGILAGSMTDPPALAFANSFSASNAPAVAYATVYPLVMILRVICAQLLVIFLMN